MKEPSRHVQNPQHRHPATVALAVALVAFGGIPLLSSREGEARAGVAGPGPSTIDLALCIDTSGTMDKLLDAARIQLWQVVADLATSDPAPRLRVAILTYGNILGSEANGWVRVESPLADELDNVASRLSEIRIAGDKEYVARVIQTAVRQLDWDRAEGTRRLIMVLGNESAAQDPLVTLEQAVREASDAGIEIHLAYCGSASEGARRSWQSLALLAGTTFLAIDPAAGTGLPTSPFDDELATLGAALSETYVPLGPAGETAQALQARQDRGALATSPAAAAVRAEAKAGALYTARWDAVTAVQGGSLAPEAIAEKDLPAALRGLDPEQRRQKLEEMAAERDRLRARIAELARQRREYLAARAAQPGTPPPPAALADAVLRAVQGSSK
jgi:hypothetical protein